MGVLFEKYVLPGFTRVAYPEGTDWRCRKPFDVGSCEGVSFPEDSGVTHCPECGDILRVVVSRTTHHAG